MHERYARRMPNAAQQVFDRTAATYDKDRARLIPGFERFYQWAVDLIPSSARTIVDLGAGTGLLSALVSARFPRAELHLIDISEAMLTKAVERLPADARITSQVADYSAISLPGADTFVSALSIHHLVDQAKQELFQSIFKALTPGGTFINAEQVLGPGPELEALYRSMWLEQVRTLGATEDQIADSLLRQEQDRCATVEHQLAWMRSAGFEEVDCWFKDGRFAILAGTKPPAGLLSPGPAALRLS